MSNPSSPSGHNQREVYPQVFLAHSNYSFIFLYIARLGLGVVLQDWVSLCSCPGACSIDQASLGLIDPPVSVFQVLALHPACHTHLAFMWMVGILNLSLHISVVLSPLSYFFNTPKKFFEKRKRILRAHLNSNVQDWRRIEEVGH